MARQKHSEKRLDERLDEGDEKDEPRGILELFTADEDAPISRDQDEDDRP
jgi:hypothetical protein